MENDKNWYGYIIVEDHLRVLVAEEWNTKKWQANQKLTGYACCTHPFVASDVREALEQASYQLARMNIHYHQTRP